MAVVVEPVVTAEKLREVLAEACEQPALDYKRVLDLSERRDVVDIAKDVGAMQALERGGYIVVGADDFGVSTGTLSEAQAKGFDEAKLRPALRKYIPNVAVQSACHQIDGNWLVLIYVAPSPDGCCVFAVEGTYQEGKKPTVVFRAGDVFMRHGTSSERWNQSDVAPLWQRVTAGLKEEWRQELRAELQAQGLVGNAAQHVRQQSATALTWQLDEQLFDASVLEYLRADDDIPLRQFLLQAPLQASGLIATSSGDLATLLNRVASLGAAGLVHQRSQWAKMATDALVAIYNLGDRTQNHHRGDAVAQRLWLMVLERVYGLGGLAVRMRDWSMLRYLADRRGTDSGFAWFESWLRHGLTEAARAHMLSDNGSYSSGLIAAAHNVVREVSALHPDTPADSETVLDSLCQFDALGALVVIGVQGNADDRNFYTNFARYRSDRTEPALTAITQDEEIRTALFTGKDELLREGLLNMLRIADYEGARYMGWSGVQDEQLRNFLQAG